MTTLLSHTERYAYGFAALKADTLDTLSAIAAPAIVFQDPFHTLYGIDALKRLLSHMFKTTTSATFIIHDCTASDCAGYIYWQFTATPHRWPKSLAFNGMSRVEFDAMGLATAHVDYWDASTAIYQHLPVFGGVVRMVRQQAARQIASAT